MTRQDFIKYVCEQYKELFKDKYNESRAMESANKLADTYKDHWDDGKDAVTAIVNRTKAKMEASAREQLHDSSDKCILRVKMGNDIVHFYANGGIRINADKHENFFKPDEPVKVVIDRVKDKLNYKGEVKAFDVNELKWIMKLGSKEINIGPNGHVFVDGVLQSWMIDPRKPFMDIMKELGDHFKGVPTDESLARIKEELHDAPVEVKSAFNSIINYFDIDE